MLLTIFLVFLLLSFLSGSMRHGFLLIHKPVGPTSHDVVALLRRSLHETRIGHLGTLDPQASGLLVLAVGAKALKTIDLFRHLSKEYVADIILGATSTTYDREGMITQTVLKSGWTAPADASRIRTVIDHHFLGAVSQLPPRYSAISIRGTRAYDLARAGEDVVMPPRTVTISDCRILLYDYPRLRLHIACSVGTYIRSLAHDLGARLHCGGYLDGLVRSTVGEWQLANARHPDDVNWTDILPLKIALQHFPRIDLSSDAWDHIRHGRVIDGQCDGVLIAWYDALPVAIMENDTRAVGKLKARKVF